MKTRPITEAEKKYMYTQDDQILEQTGCVGHLRGDFDRTGNGFYTSWEDHRMEHKTAAFLTELDNVINALRSEEYGLLASRTGMCKFADQYPDSFHEVSYGTDYGFRADTGKYSFVIRCNPMPGDYNFYCYCYVTELLDGYMKAENKETRLVYHSEDIGDTEVELDIQIYQDNGGIFIGLICNEEGYPESFGDVTVNMNASVPAYCGYLDTNNLPEVEAFITGNGLGAFTGLTRRSGYCQYPLYQFNAEKLRALCPEQMESYERSIGGSKKEQGKEKSR